MPRPLFHHLLSALERGETPPAEELQLLIDAEGEEFQELAERAQRVRLQRIGPNVYLRGLIELGNVCRKNCYYCGIRRDNVRIRRYTIPWEEALQAAIQTHRAGLGSLAIQAGERNDAPFVEGIADLLRSIHRHTNGELGITLSLGEQSLATYRAWHEAGAARYLLRIETSAPSLYGTLHPADHSWEERVACLGRIREAGLQVGTGVMIGLPGQTLQQLAEDLLWIREADIDMVGMGPYISHLDTPLWGARDSLWPETVRLRRSLNMVAVLRLLMPSINIAATTALQAIRANARGLAVARGANVIMPNVTPNGRQDDYSLYDRKPLARSSAGDTPDTLVREVEEAGCHIALGVQGNSLHFVERTRRG